MLGTLGFVLKPQPFIKDSITVDRERQQGREKSDRLQAKVPLAVLKIRCENHNRKTGLNFCKALTFGLAITLINLGSSVVSLSTLGSM